MDPDFWTTPLDRKSSSDVGDWLQVQLPRKEWIHGTEETGL